MLIRLALVSRMDARLMHSLVPHFFMVERKQLVEE